MKTLLLVLILAITSLAQDVSAPHKRTREEAYQLLDKQNKDQLINTILDQVYPPNLIGKMLPAGVGTPGKTTIAIFMQSHCGYCAKEMPYLKTLNETAKSAVVVPVFYVQDPDTKVFLSKYEYDGKIAVVEREAMATFAHGTPTTVVADATGKVIASYVGLLNPTQQQELNKLAGL